MMYRFKTIDELRIQRAIERKLKRIPTREKIIDLFGLQSNLDYDRRYKHLEGKVIPSEIYSILSGTTRSGFGGDVIEYDTCEIYDDYWESFKEWVLTEVAPGNTLDYTEDNYSGWHPELERFFPHGLGFSFSGKLIAIEGYTGEVVVDVAIGDNVIIDVIDRVVNVHDIVKDLDKEEIFIVTEDGLRIPVSAVKCKVEDKVINKFK